MSNLYIKNRDDLGGPIMALIALSAIVGAIILSLGLVLLVLAGMLVVSVLRARPNSVPVWATLSVFALTLLFVLFSQGQPVTFMLCLASFAAVVITCLIEKANHPELFKKTDKLPAVTDLIRNQWWPEQEEEDDND